MSIRVERLDADARVAVVTIDAPSTSNAITRPMLVHLARAFRELRDAENPAVRACVLAARGRKAFSAGIDLSAAEDVFKMDANDLTNDIVHQMERCDFLIVGAINGVAVNAGFELALACDVLVCSPRAAWIDTHAKLGLLPSWGLSAKLPRIVGAKAANAVSLAGAPLDADAALRCVQSLTLVPIRPRRLGERRSLRTFAVLFLFPPLAHNPDAHTSTPLNSASDAFQLRPDIIARWTLDPEARARAPRRGGGGRRRRVLPARGRRRR